MGYVSQKDPYDHRKTEPNSQDFHGGPFRTMQDISDLSSEVYTIIA